MLDYARFSKLLAARTLVSLALVSLALVSSCSYTGSKRDDPYWTSRKNSLQLIELSSVNKVRLVVALYSTVQLLL
jgi:hypothetical protein